MPRLRLLFLLIICNPALASSIDVGLPLPDLAISDRGELILEQDEFSYAPWQSPGAHGKVHVLQYLAGTLKARSQSKPFTDRLEESLPIAGYHVTTIINLDDALWGTRGFVVNEVEESKRKYPASTIVLDESGTGLGAWQLMPKGATIVVLDADGAVLYFKQGGMSEQEIESTLNLIRLQIGDQN